MSKWDVCALAELERQDGDYANTWVVSAIGNGPGLRSRGGVGRGGEGEGEGGQMWHLVRGYINWDGFNPTPTQFVPSLGLI